MSLWSNDEHPWVNETSEVRITRRVDSLDVSIRFKISVMIFVLELVIFLPCLIINFLKLIDAIDFVSEGFVKVSRYDVDIFLDFRDIAIENTWCVGSIWLIHDFQIV